jgi:hypothetical protein
MARGTIRIRYKVQVTRRVRVQTRVRYSVRVLTTVRHVIAEARERGHVRFNEDQDQLFENAYALLPPGTDEDEIRDAIDTVCREVDEDG